MTKLKLTRMQLQVLTTCTNPKMIEDKIIAYIRQGILVDMDFLFTMMELGEKFTKKYLFNNKPKYSITLKYNEAAALISFIAELERVQWDAFTVVTLQHAKNVAHLAITGYKQQLA